MRLLLINPNTTQAITDLVATRARDVVGPGHEIRAVTGRFGARYVACRAAFAVAGHAALDALAEHVEGADAALLACFGDPGLLALKEVSPVPVVGMAEASCRLAARRAGRFAIVTGGERWGPMLREFVASVGLADRLAAVRTVAPTGAEIAADPQRAVAVLARACAACVEENGADVVILGGAGLAGLAATVGPLSPAPVICSLEAGLAAALAMGGAPDAWRPGTASVETVGLRPALAALMGEPAARPPG